MCESRLSNGYGLPRCIEQDHTLARLDAPNLVDLCAGVGRGGHDAGARAFRSREGNFVAVPCGDGTLYRFGSPKLSARGRQWNASRIDADPHVRDVGNMAE